MDGEAVADRLTNTCEAEKREQQEAMERSLTRDEEMCIRDRQTAHILFYTAFSRPLQSSWPSVDRGAEYETRQSSTKSPHPRGSSDPPPAKQTHL